MSRNKTSGIAEHALQKVLATRSASQPAYWALDLACGHVAFASGARKPRITVAYCERCDDSDRSPIAVEWP